MSVNLIGDRLLDETEGVKILDLGPDSKLFLPLGTHRNIGVTAQLAFFHVTFGNAEVRHQRMEFLHICLGLFRSAQVWFADDLQQGSPGAVEVHKARLSGGFMHELSGVFLDVDARDADAFGSGFGVDHHPAAFADRAVVLRNLIRLGQVRIEVVLAGELRVEPDFAMGRQS